jgi:hypothetical protein
MVNVKFEIPAEQIARLNREFRSFVEVLGKDLHKEVENQSRLLLRDCINFTPPTVVGGNVYRQAAPQEQRKQGERAVESDFERLFEPLGKLEIVRNPKNKQLGVAIRRAIREKNFEALAEILKRAAKITSQIVDSATNDIHRKNRNKRGRVRKMKNPILVHQASTIGRLQREAQKRVGYAKAGWENAATRLRLALPNWVKRHSAPGYIVKQGGKLNPTIEFANGVPYVQRLRENIVGRAIRNRIEAMRKQVAHMLEKRAGEFNRR